MEGSFSEDGEENLSSDANSSRKRGGWITFPFITGTMAGLSLAAGGWMMNLIVYLIEEFNIKSIDAAQISNVINGCTTLFPIAGAIIADSFLGLFPVISISSLISLLGIVLLTLTAKIGSLRPPKCDTGSILCKSPTKSQFAILYTSLALASLGVGGTRFTIGTMGGNQFDKPDDQGTFFNWFFFTMYTSIIVSVTAIIYVEDSVSWTLGFGLSLAANLLGLAIFVAGKRYYRLVKPQGSPFMAMACVVVAAFRKRKALLSLRSEDYYHHPYDEAPKEVGATPTKTFKFLNRAALKETGDTKADGSVASPWNLCTLQQVEDFKSLMRILPVLSTGIFLSTPIAIQNSLFVLQALTMDRRVGRHGFKIPAGTMAVFLQLSTCFCLAFIDRFLFPVWQKFKSRRPTPLQRIGTGHVLIVLSMAVSALVESKRLSIAHSHRLNQGHSSKDGGSNSQIVPMSVFWLVPPLVLVGAGEAFHFPGQIDLYYQEFPAALKSTSTAMVALLIGIAYYLGTAIVDSVRRVTGWLPDDISEGRMDNVYWMLVVVGGLNYGYFLVCAWLYKYQNVDQKQLENDTTSDS